MKVILGIPDARVPVWELGTPLMVNQLSWDRVPWPNETWVDSGGYQIMLRGVKVDLNAVLEKYKLLDAKYYMSLDVPPPTPCSKPSEVNFKHFEYLYTSLEKKIIPVIHAYDVESLKEAVDFYSQYTDTVAFGGIVPPSLNGGGGKKLAIATYKLLRREWKGKVHVLGAGSPFMRKLFYDADSVDTSTYRIKAIHGMVLIPGLGERYVGDRKIVWKAKRATHEEVETLLSFLEKTRFPFTPKLDHWKGRALINAWVLLHSEYEVDNPLIAYSKELEDPEEEVNELCLRKAL
ncbi:MAG: hypothetical protein K1T65_03995 [Candidatus Aramenus sp.]|nr:hypothetical protein [Candidatus Aramenus sp.]